MNGGIIWIVYSARLQAAKYHAIFYDPPGFEIYTKKLVVHNVRVLLVELKP